MATVTATSKAMGITEFSSGSFTSDNTTTTVTLGFKPRWVKIINSTDTIVWEKFEGMAAANCLKTVNHDTAQHSIDTGSHLLINSDGTLTLSQTLVGSSKAISWVAMG